MKVQYSEHIKNRLKFRKIDYDLPKIIFEQSEDKFIDTETGHFISVMNDVNLNNKNREVMIAYTFHEDYVTLLTIHPLKEGQKEKRINTGRWRRIL
jgi:hypothetical protein